MANDPGNLDCIRTYKSYKGRDQIFVGNGNSLHITHIGTMLS